MGAATTGDGEGTGEEKELDWHPPHVRSSPTFQSWLRLWPYRVHEMQRCGLLLGLPTFRGLSVCLCVCWSQPRAVLKRLNRSRCRSGCDSWGQRKHVRVGPEFRREGALLEPRLGHAETCPGSLFSTLFARGQERCGAWLPVSVAGNWIVC